MISRHRCLKLLLLLLAVALLTIGSSRAPLSLAR
jgi:hypothetical protein